MKIKRNGIGGEVSTLLIYFAKVPPVPSLFMEAKP